MQQHATLQPAPEAGPSHHQDPDDTTSPHLQSLFVEFSGLRKLLKGSQGNFENLLQLASANGDPMTGNPERDQLYHLLQLLDEAATTLDANYMATRDQLNIMASEKAASDQNAASAGTALQQLAAQKVEEQNHLHGTIRALRAELDATRTAPFLHPSSAGASAMATPTSTRAPTPTVPLAPALTVPAAPTTDAGQDAQYQPQHPFRPRGSEPPVFSGTEKDETRR
jgi:hypothetical protein